MEDMFDIIKSRRSIRKYQQTKVPRQELEKILEAGVYAPNAGGGQRCKIVAVQNRELVEKLGRANIAGFDRANLAGGSVSAEQPSIIDDPTMKSGFYGAPTVCVIFGPKNFLYSTPDAFCCADNMVLMAHALGISSCIVARAEETFAGGIGAELLIKWGIPDSLTARCFVLLGYCAGDYPPEKPRKPGRSLIVEE